MINRNATHFYRHHLMTAVSLIAVAAAATVAMAGAAQAADSAQTAQAQTAQAPRIEEEIIVTGSRIVRNGYEAPTPVSVLSADDLNLGGQGNITDTIVKMPVFSNSLLPRGKSTSSDVTGTAGFSVLNLRSIGTNRTLVLFDGKRMAGSSVDGTVDTNLIPDGVIKRIDVVTGGASAVYGSDAISGVVNFILDKEFTGVKGSVEGGLTDYGDERNYKLTLNVGMPFANGRGHVLVAFEHMYSGGISGCPRDWCQAHNYQAVVNPTYSATNGQPQYLAVYDTGNALAAPGGLITAGPLKGTYFGAGGSTGQLNYGTVSGGYMIGGDWRFTNFQNNPSLPINFDTDLSFKQKRRTAYAHVEYNVTDDVNVYGEFQWGQSEVTNKNASSWDFGDLTIKSGNPFIPASVQAQMNTLGLTSFALGTFHADVGPLLLDNGDVFRRYVVGLQGTVNAFDIDWKWNAYGEISTNHIHSADFAVNTINMKQAIDDVRDPRSGNIICRSTLTNPNDGCIPYNVMGISVNTPQAVDYVSGWGQGSQRLIQRVADLDFSGEPFSTWAGPVSLALGMTYRRESVDGVQFPLENANAYFAGNYHATYGHYDVKEGFAETVVPLAKDTAWAKSFDLNAAVRATDYSTAGYVTTWKVGASYAPVDDFRLRASRSRDIRAPNLGELFLGGIVDVGTVNDPVKHATISTQVARIGNVSLVPEKADQIGLGGVYSPSWFHGFSASVDYYHIKINGSIGATGNYQSIVDGCFGGNASLCQLITRDANQNIVFIKRAPANLNYEADSGLDFEASYTTPLSAMVDNWDGNLSLRFLGTYYLQNLVSSGPNTYDGAGVNAFGSLGIGFTAGQVARFIYSASATYTLDPITVSLSGRGFSSGVYNTNAIQCTANCPTPTGTQFTINDNKAPGQLLFDLAFNYKFAEGMEAFLNIENLMNRNPPYIPNTLGGGYYSWGNSYYDQIGRQFHMGLRFKM